MVLLHYPRCWPELCGAEFSVTAAALEKRGESLPLEKRGESSRGAGEQHGWQGSWRALELLVRQRRVLAIGVFIVGVSMCVCVCVCVCVRERESE